MDNPQDPSVLLPAFASLQNVSEPLPQNIPPKSVYVALPLIHPSTLSPKARLVGLCTALGFKRPPTYEVKPGEHAGYTASVCIYPPPEPHTELRLQCVILCNSKREAELAAADQAMQVLLRTT